jgi:hypothetical protein
LFYRMQKAFFTEVFPGVMSVIYARANLAFITRR